MMKRLLHVLLAVLALWSCNKSNSDPVPENPMPTEVSFTPSSLSFPQEGGTVSITVTAPSRPRIDGAPSWLKVEDGVYNNYKISYKFTASYNGGEDRSETVTLKAGSLSASLIVSQDGYEVIPLDWDTNLTNTNASSSAQKVYQVLLKNAGHKILSGVQSGGTANNNERVNQVYTMTGKHPAVAGYDYIFLQYSPTPAGWTWVVDYGDISAPKEQWDNNGLVTFMWHWNVPTSKEAWDLAKSDYKFDGYGFYAPGAHKGEGETSFSISNALSPGTWENDFILQDIEKVAGYLKLLQDAGIPVLWRPLHEAAGNYNLYGGNGAWFWWGRGGADACKKLWKLLRDKLEGEYGLNNLIWVWTLDATPGAEFDYASWYPGNDLVDLVGVDIYADDTEAKARQYAAAVALSGGRKLVTVSECGNIPNPEKCLADHEYWNWFLAWDLDSFKLNTNEYWNKLMSSGRVHTRESMPSLK